MANQSFINGRAGSSNLVSAIWSAQFWQVQVWGVEVWGGQFGECKFCKWEKMCSTFGQMQVWQNLVFVEMQVWQVWYVCANLGKFAKLGKCRLDQGFLTFCYLRSLKSKFYPSAYPQIKNSTQISFFLLGFKILHTPCKLLMYPRLRTTGLDHFIKLD